MESVNIDMAKKKRISEKEISKEYELLQYTHNFLCSLRNKKNSELQFCLKKLESEYSDELPARTETVYAELQNLEKKINWEIKRCAEFDQKVDKWKNQTQNQFISELSKKILNRDNKS